MYDSSFACMVNIFKNQKNNPSHWYFPQMELPLRPTLFDFHGVSMTKYFTDNWDDIQNFKARPDDILIATYPKAGGVVCVREYGTFGIIVIIINLIILGRWTDQATVFICVLISGTTWVSYILDLLYFGQMCPERQTSIPIQERVPFLEISIPYGVKGFVSCVHNHICMTS